MKRYRILLIFLLIIAAPYQSAGAQTFLLDNFEAATRRIVRPGDPGATKYLWHLLSAADNTSFTTAEKYSGSQSLKNIYPGGAGTWQFYLNTYTENLSGWGTDGQKYIWRFVNNPNMNFSGGSPAWPPSNINRLRFWIKVPPTITLDTVGDHNFEFGTYIQSAENSTSGNGPGETDGNHWYHFYNFGSTGEWEQVIVDTFPDYLRNVGFPEQDKDNIYGTRTYFDKMSHFYLDFWHENSAGTFYIDGFEFYADTNPHNLAEVRSLHSVYVPSSNLIRVGWARSSDFDRAFDVRYAFSDIFALGWAKATIPANGSVPANGGNSMMSWSSTALNLSGQSTLYVAIAPKGTSNFSQISIPLTGAKISAPANLRSLP